MSSVTFTVPASRPRRGSAVADAVLEAAVDVARSAVVEAAGADDVGEHEGVAVEGQRLATHYFACTAGAYRGWRWAVTLARAPRAKAATVCEVALLAGHDAVQPPPWVPWSERLQPGDVGRADVLPYSADDARLMPGYAATGDADADAVALYELGLGRPRVLSPEGRAEAATRWYGGEHGPAGPAAATVVRGADSRGRGARVAAQCSTCGFLMPMAGSMRTVFGVCSNEWSPDDGQVVSMDHGCGAHSETDVLDGRRDWPENAPVVDDHALEMVESDPTGGASTGAAPSDGPGTAEGYGPTEPEPEPEPEPEAAREREPEPAAPERGQEPEPAAAPEREQEREQEPTVDRAEAEPVAAPEPEPGPEPVPVPGERTEG